MKLFRDDSTKKIDDLINELLTEMDTKDVYSDEYQILLTRVERLNEVKTNQSRNFVSRDTIAVIAGNCLITLGIVLYENKHLMTSKGWNHLIRLK